jgi:hypothetical protein
MLTDLAKLEAALAELEAEKQRRIDDKVDKGEGVRVTSPVVVVGVEQPTDALLQRAKADKIAELRAAGEKREIHFDANKPTVIVTGVPRAGRDDGEPARPQTAGNESSAPSL